MAGVFETFHSHFNIIVDCVANDFFELITKYFVKVFNGQWIL